MQDTTEGRFNQTGSIVHYRHASSENAKHPDKPETHIYHESVIDLDTGELDCSCRDFECVKRPTARAFYQNDEYQPNIGDLAFMCRHLIQDVGDCVKRGEIVIDKPKGRIMDEKEIQARQSEERQRVIAELQGKLQGDRVKKIQGNDYLETHDVIDRLNEVFGFDGWSYLVKNIRAIDALNHYWMAEVGLTVVIDDVAVTREDVGCGAITFTKDRGWLENAAEFDKATKSAISDGLKRCARTFGNQFGNSLYEKNPADRYESVPAQRSTPNGNGTYQQPQAPAQRQAPAAPRAAQGNQNGNGYGPPDPNKLRIAVIPSDTNAASCNKCTCTIYWVPNKNGKNIPHNGDGTCHFDTCNQAEPDLAAHNNSRLGANPNNPQAGMEPPPSEPISETGLNHLVAKARVLVGDMEAYQHLCERTNELTSGHKTTPEELTKAEGKIVYDALCVDIQEGGSRAGEEAAMGAAMEAAARDN